MLRPPRHSSERFDFTLAQPANASLDSTTGDGGFACHLCKTPFDSERVGTRIVSLINETGLQIRQSRNLQERRMERLVRAEKSLQGRESAWGEASRRLAAAQRLPSSEARQRLRDLQRRAGYVDRQIEDLEEKAKTVELVRQLSIQKEELNARIESLKGDSDARRAAQQQRLSRAYSAIADEVRTLLHNDLPRENAFENASQIAFDFFKNAISVDGQSYFSASSRVVLKSSFFLGFFAAATKLAYFRHPRFLMLDTVEDKGMEPVRSHNFQREIARISSESRVDHQIIFATAMIAPELDDPAYTIGRQSTHDRRTIEIAQ